MICSSFALLLWPYHNNNKKKKNKNSYLLLKNGKTIQSLVTRTLFKNLHSKIFYVRA